MKSANFQALTQDLLTINLDVRFSIPPYVSLLARSVATLEGVALQGDPQYQIVSQAYPFVVRKLLNNNSRQSFQSLRELLYDPKTQRLRPQRLSTMLQASMGMVADANKADGFIDFDTAPDESAPLSEVVAFLLSEQSRNLRPLLNAELSYGLDLVLRRAGRRARTRVRDLLQPRVPVLGFRLPAPPVLPVLVPLPRTEDAATGDNGDQLPRFRLMHPDDIVDAVLPPLSPSDDVALQTFNEAAQGVLLDGEATDLELSPSMVRAVLQSLVNAEGRSDAHDSAAGKVGKVVAELVDTLRATLLVPQSRSALANEVLLSVARELIRTWRARLAATT